MKKSIKIAIIVLFVAVLGYGVYYMTDYYPAESSVSSMINSNNVSVINTTNGLLLDGPGCDTALIFYPGAKVEYTAYIPLLMELSNNNVDCFIVKMPFNLAFIGSDSADDLISNHSYNYSNWYIGGHSLGGLAASSYTTKHNDNIKGLILLASYPTEKVDNNVLSIYGSEDKILNKEKYEESKKFLPDNYTEYVINGANHAQFGAYGRQENDGAATISLDMQINQTCDEILKFINGV